MRCEPGPLVVALLVLAASAAGPAGAAWPQPRADARNTGASGPIASGNASVHWTASLSFSLLAPPAVADGTVLLASDEIYALEAASGDERWSFRPSWENFTLPRGWLRGTPVTDGETVAVATSYPSLHALDLDTGAERWRLETDNRPSSLAIAGQTLYTVRDENVTAHHLSTGEEDWRVHAGARVSGITPDEGTVFAATFSPSTPDDRVLALDASTGDRVWSRPANASLLEPPAVDETTVAVAYRAHVDGEHGVLVLERSTGEVRWDVETEGEPTDPVALAEGTVLAVTTTEPRQRHAAETLEALAIDDGHERWSAPNVSGPVAVAGSIAYVGGSNVQGLSVADGSQARFVASPPAHAQHITAGEGRLFAWAGDTLYATDGGHPVHAEPDGWAHGLPLSLVGLAALALVAASLLRDRSAA